MTKSILRDLLQIIIFVSTIVIFGGCKEAVKVYYQDGKLKTRYTAVKDSSSQLVKEGKCEAWYTNGKLFSITHFKSGKEHGMVKHFHEDGSLWRTENFDNGKRIGVRTEYNKDGTLFVECHYEDGSKHGEHREFYPEGTRRYFCNFVKGKKDGPDTAWHKNGSLHWTGNYERGKKKGTFNYFDSTCTLLKTEDFDLQAAKID